MGGVRDLVVPHVDLEGTSVDRVTIPGHLNGVETSGLRRECRQTYKYPGSVVSLSLYMGIPFITNNNNSNSLNPLKSVFSQRVHFPRQQCPPSWI